MTSVPMGGKKEFVGAGGGAPVVSGSGGAIALGKWDYMFVVEFAASNDPAVNQAALDNLREFAAKVRILGEYSSAEAMARRMINSTQDVDMLTYGF